MQYKVITLFHYKFCQCPVKRKPFMWKDIMTGENDLRFYHRRQDCITGCKIGMPPLYYHEFRLHGIYHTGSPHYIKRICRVQNKPCPFKFEAVIFVIALFFLKQYLGILHRVRNQFCAEFLTQSLRKKSGVMRDPTLIRIDGSNDRYLCRRSLHASSFRLIMSYLSGVSENFT